MFDNVEGLLISILYTVSRTLASLLRMLASLLVPQYTMQCQIGSTLVVVVKSP